MQLTISQRRLDLILRDFSGKRDEEMTGSTLSDEIGVCWYMRVPFGSIDRVPLTLVQCYQNYNGNGYVVVRWVGPNGDPYHMNMPSRTEQLEDADQTAIAEWIKGAYAGLNERARDQVRDWIVQGSSAGPDDVA